MDADELNVCIEIYNTKIKPMIEEGKYQEASVYLSGLKIIFQEECIKNIMNLSLNNPYLLQTSVSAKLLNDAIEKKQKNINNIKKFQREFEMYFKQYKMRLEALVNSQS